MYNYIIRRLLLMPITLFFIVLVNFVIINMAPGEPVTITEISQQGGGATRNAAKSFAFGADEQYLEFREHYGLTLPILFNTWPSLSENYVKETLWKLLNRKESPQSIESMNTQSFNNLRIHFGDQSKFIMPLLLNVIEDPKENIEIRRMAASFFIRGGTRQAILGPNLSEKQKEYNRKIDKDNDLLNGLIILPTDTQQQFEQKAKKLRQWYQDNQAYYQFQPAFWQKVDIFFFDSRFFHYLSRVLTLDFGTLRNDNNKTVIGEVTKRFKISLTLAVLPMFITFFLCQALGFAMAVQHNRWPDFTINFICLVLYAIPVFVVAPFLIEKVALNRDFPFTNIPIPISGFNSPEEIYNRQNSLQRLYDIVEHVFLPMIAIMYGSLAAQARLSRTAVLEVMRQDYVRTARAKGVAPSGILIKHVAEMPPSLSSLQLQDLWGLCSEAR